MKKIIRIGSRESRLAVIQAELVRDQILKAAPDYEVELITMKTTGDMILDRSLDTLGGKGLFVKELDRALLDGRVDITVHSLKDMPMETNPELPILAFSKREDPRDALILNPDSSGFPENGLVGTSSKRRALQLKKLYPQSRTCGIRGNVQTRLRKLTEENMDATILAAAGLNRLGMEKHIGRYFTVDEMIPAAGQGILGIQGRAGEDYPWIEALDCEESRYAALAERQFVRVLDGGCSSPVAAHAVICGQELYLRGLYYNECDDSYFTSEITGNVKDAEKLGETLAFKMQKEAQDE